MTSVNGNTIGLEQVNDLLITRLGLVPRSVTNVVAGPLRAIANGMHGLSDAWWWVVPLAALLLTLARIGGLAFLILIDMSLLIYFVPYIYLFIAFMVRCHKRNRKIDQPLIAPGGRNGALIIGLRGLAVTLFAMVVAMMPPPGTSAILTYEAKVAGGSLFLILIGFIIYWQAKSKRLA